MKVSGPNAPNPPIPPGNWNGIFIREERFRYPDDPATPENEGGTAVDADFNGVTAAALCQVTSQGFIVGMGGAEAIFPPITDFSCPAPAADDRFYDDYFIKSNNKVLNGTAIGADSQKTVICRHVYKCKDTVLNTGGPNKAFKATFTFANWEPPQHKDTGITATEVGYTRAVD